MPRYVTRKCPRCKFTFEWLKQDWSSFGDPRIKCPKCGLTVIFSNVKEWKLRKTSNKISIIFNYYVFDNFVYVIFVLLALLIIVSLMFNIFFDASYDEIKNEHNFTPFWFGAAIISFIVISIKRHKTFIKMIKESNQRMANEEYARVMKLIFRIK